MANDKKFVVKNGLQANNVAFVNESNATNVIEASMLSTDTLSFSGNSGQLFSISDTMSGVIFGVNDVSGIPSIEVDDTGDVRIAEFSGNVSIGTSLDTHKLYVQGNAVVNGTLLISNLATTDINVTGNLTVLGTTTYINSTALNIGDSLITLNADLPIGTAPTENAGIEINRGSSANVQFLWDETNDRWSTNGQPLALSSLVATGAASGITTLAAGNTTITGFVNATSSVNSALFTIGSNFIANTTGVYHAGVVNAASHTVGSSYIANTTQITHGVTTLINNNTQLRFQTVNTSSYAYMVQQNDDNFVFYTSNTTYGQRAVWSIFANTTNSALDVVVPFKPSSGLIANNTIGSPGQVLKTNGSTIYWDTAGGTGTVTNIATANGLSGGPITATGTLGVVTGSTLTVNATGIHVNSALSIDRLLTSNNGAGTNIGIGDDAWFGDINQADTVSIRGQQNPNNGYIIFGDADTTSKLGRAGLGPLTYNGSFTVNGTSNAATLSVGSSFVANSTRLVIGTAVGLQANGGIGSAGQVLHSNGTTAYWAADDGITSLVAANGLSGGTITATGQIDVVGGAGLISNSTGVHVGQGNGISVLADTVVVTGGPSITVNTTGVHVNATLSLTDLTLAGNLTVSGTTTYINSTALNIGDNLITLNADLPGATAPTENAGIEINRGSSANVQFLWDETNDRWSTNGQPLALSSLIATGAASGITTLAVGNTTITGFANVSVSVNTAAFTVGTTVVANSTGTYATFLNNKTESNLNVNTATFSNTITVPDTRNAVTTPETTTGPHVRFDFKTNTTDGLTDGGTYFGEMTFRPYGSGTDWSGGPAHQLGFTANNNIYHRSGTSTTWGSWGRLYKENTVLAAANSTITGFANVSLGVNSAAFTVGTTIIANTTGITTSVGANTINLINATSNWIYWNTAGVGAPTVTTRSAGTKLILYPAIAAGSVDYAVGIEGSHLWFSAAATTAGFKWYSNTTNIMTANTTGLLLAGSLSGVSTLATGNSTIRGFANVITTGDSQAGLSVSNNGVGIHLVANGSSGVYNGLVAAGDNLIYFTNNVINNGNLVIGSWTSRPAGYGFRFTGNSYDISVVANTVTFASPVSGITTLASGNATISGFANIISGNVQLSNGFDIVSPDNFAIYDSTGTRDRFGFSTNNLYDTRAGGRHVFNVAGTNVANLTANSILLAPNVGTLGSIDDALEIFPTILTTSHAVRNFVRLVDTYNSGGNGQALYIKSLTNGAHYGGWMLNATWGQGIRIGSSADGADAANSIISTYAQVNPTSLSTVGLTFSTGNTTITGFANVSVSVNTALYTVGTTVVANTSGVYATQLGGLGSGSYMRTDVSTTNTVDVRAPIFYDQNNTGFYIDPNNSSVANSFTASVYTQQPTGVPRINLGTPSVTEMALFDSQFDNKTERHPIANIWVETSTDNVTWTDATPTDANKRLLVGGDAFSGIVIPNGTAYFRIRMRATGYVYLNALYGYLSWNGHSTQVQIFKKHDSDTATPPASPWTQHTNSTATVSAWPGHLWMPFPTIPWHYAGTQGTHYHEFYILFIPTWNPSFPTNDINVSKIQVWGGYPAGKRNLYATDEFGNALFPANTSSTVAVNAPIFYDRDNTAYFLDAGNTGTALATAGNVGFGTTSPGARLHVVGSSLIDADNTSGTQLTIRGATNTNNRLYMGYDTDDNVGRITAITEGTAFRDLILQGGGANVGIGTSTPSGKLHVNGSVRFEHAGDRVIDFVRASANTFSIEHDTARMYFYNVTTANSVMAFTNASDVGIGTGNPAAKLHVIGGQSIIQNDSAAYSLWKDGSPSKAWQYALVGGTNHSYFRHYNGTVWNELVRIQDDGNVGIGTNSPGSKLTIQNSNGYNELGFSGTEHTNIYSATTSGIDIGITSTSSAYIRFLTNNTEQVRLNSGGDLSIGSASTVGKLSVNLASATSSGATAGLGAWDNTYVTFGSVGTTANSVAIGYNTSTGGSLVSLSPAVAWRRMNYLALEHRFYRDGATEAFAIDSSSRLISYGPMVAWNTTIPGTGIGSLHIGAASATADTGGAITFGARDSGSGGTGQAGIYINSGGGYGTRMYFATTNNYTNGSITGLSIDEIGIVRAPRDSMRAKIFYDHDDSTYYLDPANTSTSLLVAGAVGVGTTTPRGTLSLGTSLATATTRTLHFGYTPADFYGFRLSATNTPSSTYAGTFSIQRGNGTAWTDDFIINNTGLVGVGTTSPVLKFVVSNAGAAGLELDPTAVASSPLIQAYNRSGAAYMQLTFDALQYVWRPSGTEQMRFTSAGDLAIGTTGNLNTTSKLRVRQTSGVNTLELYANTTTRVTIANDNNLVAIQEAGGNGMDLMYNASGTLTSGLRLNHSGNIGIGTTDPAQRLDVSVASGTEGNGLAVTNLQAGGYGSGINFYSLRGDGTTKLVAGAIRMIGQAAWDNATNTSSNMRFYTVGNNTLGERMMIDATGNIGIGTSTTSGGRLSVQVAASNYLLNLINGGEAGFALRTYNHGSASAPGLVFTQGIYYNTTENAAIKFYRGGGGTGGYLAFTVNDGTVGMTLDTSRNLGFGSSTRQMINLWSNNYGIGVQNSTTYFRSDGRFSWFRGGVHADTENSAGTGGTTAMTLDSSSNLIVTGEVQGSLFRDTANSACFVDPSSTSVLNTVRANTVQFSDGTAAMNLSNGTYNLINDRSGRIALYLGGTGDQASYYDNTNHYFRNTGGALYATINVTGSFANAFYDTANNTYFAKPSGTSRLNALSLDTLVVTSGVTGLTTAPIVTQENNIGTTASWMPLTHQKALYTSGYRTHLSTGLYKTADAWGSGATGWYAAIGGNDNYPTQAWYLTYDASILNSLGYVTTSGSFRAPLFYDSANTACYVDPGAGSNVLGEFNIQQSGVNGFKILSTSGTQAFWARTGYDTNGTATPAVSATNVMLQSSGSSAGTFTFVCGNTLALTVLGDYAQGAGSLRAPVYYDSANTSCYADYGATTIAASLNGRILGGFGADSTSGTLDWNHVTNSRSGSGAALLLGTDTNGPGGSIYFHPFNFEYSSKDGSGNITQLAVAYGTPANRMAMRGKYDGAWTGWCEFITNSGDSQTKSGSFASSTDIRAPIYYDSSGTTNYLDLGSTGTSLNVAGAIVAAGNITAYSDIRVKNDIVVISDAINKLDKISGITYTRTDLKDKERRFAGVIAQEIEEVLPEAVFGDDNTKTVDYNATIALLIQAVKEQQVLINKLEEKVNSLENK